MDSMTPISELGFNLRVCNSLTKFGNVYTIGELFLLLDESGVDALMKMRNLGRKSSVEILCTAKKYGYNSERAVSIYLKNHNNVDAAEWKEIIEQIHNTETIETIEDVHEPALSKQKERESRLKKNRILELAIDGPKYGNFTRVGAGLALYVTLFNKTGQLLKVECKNIMLFHDRREWCADSDYVGYIFRTGRIMPDSAKTLGKIWGNSEWKENQLVNDDYIELTLDYLGQEHIFKFVYEESGFKINDYFEYKIESNKF